jgi:hypothetical protein
VPGRFRSPGRNVHVLRITDVTSGKTRRNKGVVAPPCYGSHGDQRAGVA